MNNTRLKALQDAARDICSYCGRRAFGFEANPVHGPSGSGNWVHVKIGGGKSRLCNATPILSRIQFETATGGRS